MTCCASRHEPDLEGSQPGRPARGVRGGGRPTQVWFSRGTRGSWFSPGLHLLTCRLTDWVPTEGLGGRSVLSSFTSLPSWAGIFGAEGRTSEPEGMEGLWRSGVAGRLESPWEKAEVVFSRGSGATGAVEMTACQPWEVAQAGAQQGPCPGPGDTQE